MSATEVRVRRPRQYEPLIQEMREQGGFATMRDVLLFAAALGKVEGRRVPFDESGEPIRFETLTDPEYSSALVNMIAAVSEPEDPEILSSARLKDRIQIFEEYACGGLEYLQGELNARKMSVEILLPGLVIEGLSDDVPEPAPIEELLRGFF